MADAAEPDDRRLDTELLRGSVRSRTSQAGPALAVMVVNMVFIVPLLGGGLSLRLLAAWLVIIVSLLVVRKRVARGAARDIQGPRERLVAFDRRFRLISLASQSVTGAGIWLALTAPERELAAYVMTLLVALYGVGTMINLAHDFRTVRLSLPLLLGQPVLFWAQQGPTGVVIAVILAGLTGLMILSARNSQLTFNESIRIRFEKDAIVAQLEHEQRVAGEALRAAEAANRAKSFFMASASHDLRQPLYAATILTDTLALHPLEPRAAALVSQQREALGAASGLFDNLLDLSKFESGVVEPVLTTVRLDEVLHQMQIEYAALAESKGLYLRIGDSAPAVVSDFDLLSRLVRNLVSNAVRYTGEGGVTVSTSVDGEHVLLRVSDTGVGIAPSDQHRVFHEFVQLDNPQRSRDKGVGLGLAIVRHIAELLDHRLTIDSAVGRGTTIAVRMPRAHCTLTEPLAGTPGPGVTVEGRSVWVVEDDPLVREALRAYFQQRGALFHAAANRDELLALEREHGLPEFVILDDMLGGPDTGLDLAQWLATRLPCERILITTGNPEEARWAALTASGLAVLRKPVTTAALNDWLGAGVA